MLWRVFFRVWNWQKHLHHNIILPNSFSLNRFVICNKASNLRGKIFLDVRKKQNYVRPNKSLTNTRSSLMQYYFWFLLLIKHFYQEKNHKPHLLFKCQSQEDSFWGGFNNKNIAWKPDRPKAPQNAISLYYFQFFFSEKLLFLAV